MITKIITTAKEAEVQKKYSEKETCNKNFDEKGKRREWIKYEYTHNWELEQVICMMALLYYRDEIAFSGLYGEANFSKSLSIPRREDKFE